MEIDAILKRIRLQIKHGRTEGLEKKLEELLQLYKNTETEIILMEVYVLEYFSTSADYRCAIPAIERLLNLTISEESRSAALALLKHHQDWAAIVPSDIDVAKPEFLACMDIIREKRIFRFIPHASNISGYEVIKNLEEAELIAWHQEIDEPFESWNDLRAQASRELYGYCSKNKIRTEPLRKFSAEIDRLCESCLSETMMNFFDDVTGDLGQILFGKALGITTDLHGRMWEAYTKMAFPCGWKGEYPDGNLCVFVPDLRFNVNDI